VPHKQLKRIWTVSGRRLTQRTKDLITQVQQPLATLPMTFEQSCAVCDLVAKFTSQFDRSAAQSTSVEAARQFAVLWTHSTQDRALPADKGQKGLLRRVSSAIGDLDKQNNISIKVDGTSDIQPLFLTTRDDHTTFANLSYLCLAVFPDYFFLIYRKDTTNVSDTPQTYHKYFRYTTDTTNISDIPQTYHF
jgi:hypothetical protein